MPPPTPYPRFAHFYDVLSGATSPARVACVGDVFRAALPKWMSKPYRLTAVGSVLTGGRWNVQNLIPAMNFGTTAEVTAAEADAKAIRNGWPPGSFSPQTRVGFRLDLRAVLDLTDAKVLAAFGHTEAELITCNWESEQVAGREALTQALGRAAFETYAEGLIVPSARLRGGINIVAFPANLQAGSTITAHDESSIPFVHGL